MSWSVTVPKKKASLLYKFTEISHIQAHEVFESEEFGKMLNEDFVNVKVDREERPDIDRLYMA
jgi:uncharacterized protein YyaL (SSP411 family)